MNKLVCMIIAMAFTTIAQAATGLKFPPNWRATGEWDDAQPFSLSLPTKWDWGDYARLQPVRNQLSCGSCWAFATTAVTESLQILVSAPSTLDLAEQTLVSTCERNGDCNGGFFDAFDYIRDKGLPKESDDPYIARNSMCKQGLRPIAKVTRWAYVGSPNTPPTTQQLKQAIYDHGPIAVGVSGHFGSYRGGVFNQCQSTALDHMVVINGWVDDPQYARNGGGYWIVRNSWGQNFGNQGYMNIVYQSTSGRKCNGIAQIGAYATVNGIENLREYLHIPGLDE